MAEKIIENNKVSVIGEIISGFSFSHEVFGEGFYVVDAVIEPQDTRKHVIGALEMLYTKREGRPDKKHGTV